MPKHFDPEFKARAVRMVAEQAPAVTVVRCHRTVMLGMPRIRQTLPDLRPERTV